MSTAFPDLQVITRLTAPGAKSVKVEAFQDKETGTTAVMATVGIVYVILMVVLCLAYSVGAARLSWCYNMYIGNDAGLALFYAILAFLFSGFYYPFYAIFLSPLCGMKKAVAVSVIGGRRR
jgi:hypothetical protein